MPLAYSPMEHLMAERWVSVEQIAEHLGVTRDSIYRWIDRKGL
ncbi:MAG: helix-turn-helix domain-containing protein, partial [Xanthomonadales bacterium]|nr:helix-turn-helix domain-containing protein [Xanthomonadales bacterium]